MQSDEVKQNATAILWQGFVLVGHEACQLFSKNSSWHLQGTAVFSHEQQACRLDYRIVCDRDWRTLSAEVEGWLGNRVIDLHIETDPQRGWWLNDAEQPNVAGCMDIDLNFSPSTNLLPIRRLNLALGESTELTAAWLRFPGFTLEPLPQRYTRLDENLYRYESAGGQFVADLTVNRAGFVTNYPGIWRAETTDE